MMRASLGFGCVGVASLPSLGAALGLLDAVHDLGIAHFDTAPIYGRGYSERIVGAFAKNRRRRVMLATKFGLPREAAALPSGLALRLNALRRAVLRRAAPANEAGEPPFAPLAPRRITGAEIEHGFAASLKALQTDYLDLYLLHEGLPSFLDDAALALLARLKASGAVRALGVAANGRNYLPLDAAAFEGWDVLQYEHGRAWPAQAAIAARFPRHRHVVHSCLRGVPGPLAPTAIAAARAANAGGVVLVSSRTVAHMHANIDAV